jgi:serine protease
LRFYHKGSTAFLISLLLMMTNFAQAGLMTLKGMEIYVPGEVLVTLKSNASSDDRLHALSLVGTSKAMRRVDFYKVEIANGVSVEAAMGQLRQEPAVAAVQPNYRYHALACFNPPTDIYYNNPGPPSASGTYWPFVKIHAVEAVTFISCPATPTTASVTVAIIDTGVSTNHPDLPSGIFVPGYNYISNNTDTDDDFGHGTFVAAIIDAQWNNSGTKTCPSSGSFNGGMAGLAGIPGLVKIMPVKVLDNTGSGTSESIADGMEFALANHAQIFNLSLGGPYDPMEQTEVNTILADNGVIVAAAGNESGPLDYPAAYPGVIAVGATDPNDNVAWYSNFGTGLDLVAPGGYAGGSQFNFTGAYDPNNDIFSAIAECPTAATTEFSRASLPGPVTNTDTFLYGSADGTSFATPMVAGAAALLLALNPSMTNSQVMNQLINTADSLNGNQGWDPHTGYGRLNVFRALQNQVDITPYVNTFNSPNPFSLESDGSTNITLAINSPMAVELTIYDTAGETVFQKNYTPSELNNNPSNPQFKSYYVSWDGHNGKGNLVVPGVYFYTVNAGGMIGRNKIVVVKGAFQGTR